MNFNLNTLMVRFGRKINHSILFVMMVFCAINTSNAQYSMGPCVSPYVTTVGQAGTTKIGAGDDATFINLPFTFNYYETDFTQARVGTNGFITFPSANTRGLGNATLPTALAGAAIYPFWDDMDADISVNPATGIYVRTDGVAPNRVYTIEWYQTGHFNHATTTGEITFQVQLFETTNTIRFKYLDVLFEGSHNALYTGGLSATVGIEGPVATPRLFNLYSFNSNSLVNGQCIEFAVLPACTPIPNGVVMQNANAFTCTADVSVPIPAFDPAGCAGVGTVGLRYIFNGMTINVPSPFPPSIILQDLSTGSFSITWQTYDTGTGTTIRAATQAIEVGQPNIICPDDLVIDLQPGLCEQVVTYEVLGMSVLLILSHLL